MQETSHSSVAVSVDPDFPLIIVNPKSAGGSTSDRWSEIASDFRSHFGPFSVAFTKARGDGALLAEKYIASGRRLIIACGGDGTINEIVNGILNSGEDVVLGIMPAGTGGDFRRSIGLSTVPREAAKQLRDGRTEIIDVGRVTFGEKDGRRAQRYFVNISSFGLSVSINERVKKKGEFRWILNESIRGRTKFAISTIQEVLETQYKTVRVSIEGKESKTLNTLNFNICNGRYFGGGMKVAPDAKLNDGFFDVINIGDIKTARIMLNGYKLYRGTHLDLSEVNTLRAKHVTVESANPGESIKFETDGEISGSLPAEFEVVPRALKIIVPVD